MSVRRITDPLPGEQAVAVYPPIAPRVDAEWRRRLNLYTGRALSDTALTGEQEARAGRLTTSGQTFSHGVVAGLEVGIETEVRTVHDPDTGTDVEVREHFFHVGAGFGLTAQGEDVVVPHAVRVPLAELWVHLTPPTPVPDAVTLEEGFAAPARQVPVGADVGSVRPPVMPPPQFRGPFADLLEWGVEMLPAMVLVLEPVVARMVGSADERDPCEEDPQNDAFADWQLADGCRLALYEWPWPAPFFAEPGTQTFRNELADLVFRIEAGYGPGEFHPWELEGVPIGMVGFDEEFNPVWVDAHAVVRAGGRPRVRTALLAGVGSPFLWQARLEQFAEQVTETDWTQGAVAAVLQGNFRYLPPAGLLPRETADEDGRPLQIFPGTWAVDAVPVPAEQLDVAIEAGAALTPYDLTRPDAIRLLVPVPGAWYEPRLLLTEEVPPEFQAAVDYFAARRLEHLHRREDLRRKAEGLVEGWTGRRPSLPAPDLDPERLADEGPWIPAPRFGGLAHHSPLAEGTHGHIFRGADSVMLQPGDRLFAYVYLNPRRPPRQLMLHFWDSGNWDWRVYWGENLIPPRPTTGTVITLPMGPLPETGRWVKLEVPASRLALEGRSISGMGFWLYDGIATWDRAGVTVSTDQVWMDDSAPAGATFPDGPLAWSRLTGSTVPFNRETQVHAVIGTAGSARKSFEVDTLVIESEVEGDRAPLPVARGDVLFAYVRLDPVSPPSEIMLEWKAGGSWEHRAYWGADHIRRGTGGSPSRRFMGPLPPVGSWVRLEVPAAAVGLEGATVMGMAFHAHAGATLWDRTGVARARTRPAGGGLVGEYFRNPDFTDRIVTRTDPQVFMSNVLTGASFDPQVEGVSKSIRWTGMVVPHYTETYTFYVNTNATQLRLRVNGVPVIDRTGLSGGAVSQFSGTLKLAAEKRYEFSLEFVAGPNPPAVTLMWTSPNLGGQGVVERIPQRRLFPHGETGPAEVAEGEIVWLEDALPPRSTGNPPPGPLGTFPQGNEPWEWVAAPALDPPEEPYGTEEREGLRRASALLALRAALRAATPLREDEVEQLDLLGLEKFAAWLTAKVRRCDDVVNFGFVRVQADIYRLRQLMLGATGATRLATSPGLASIINADSAVTVREKLLEFLRDAQITPAVDDGTTALRSAPLAEGEPSESLAFAAAGDAFVSTGTRALALSAESGTISGTSFLRPVAGDDFFTDGGSSFGDTSGGTIGKISGTTALSSSLTSASAAISTSFFNPGSTVQPLATPYSSATQEVLLKQPIVGETYDFRTVTVGERLQTPAANEAKSFTLLTRYEVLTALSQLDINLDDLFLPGFLKRLADGSVVTRPAITIANKPQTIPVREVRRFSDVKARLDAEVLGETDPLDADEPRFFSLATELLDATIAALRAVEGRVQQYRDALSRCRRVLQELYAHAGGVDRRMKVVEDELAEARHDLTVARALLAEETERVRQINERRARILREHVPFLAFHRPRLAHADLGAPGRLLNPAFTQSPVPACLADTTATPAPLRDLVELLREAPVRWFLEPKKLLDKLDRFDVLLGTVRNAKLRAAFKEVAVTYDQVEAHQRGRLGKAIYSRVDVQKQVVAAHRAQVAAMDLARFNQESWRWAREQAESVLSLGDLIDAAHGRTGVDRGAAKELDDILNIATCLYENFGDVLPSIRLTWADRLSQHDEVQPNLRNLYSLPRWAEVPYLEQREMQALVDWLFQRVDPREAQAVALMNDIVRVCLLLASHAPVNELLSGATQRETEVRQGALVRLEVDLARVRVGMQVVMYDAEQRPVRAVVEDIAGGVAVTRVVEAPPQVVTLPAGTRAQLGEEARVGRPVVNPTERREVIDERRERILEKVGRRGNFLEP